MKDLFGFEIHDKLISKPGRPAGYAAQPGTGPKGEECRTCQHLSRKRLSKTYLKCGLMFKTWTAGSKTDILAHSPACRFWTMRWEREKPFLSLNLNPASRDPDKS